MVKYLNLIIVFPFLLLVISCNDNQKVNFPEMKTVEYVDIERFMGDWYVIANIPTFLETEATNAIESYSLDSNGAINTTFTFFKNGPLGKKKTYKPKGFIHNKNTNAEWKMQFIWPFKMPFYIIGLDEEYSYTVIGIPSRKYVWIMARTPYIPDKTYDDILEDLSKIGYDLKLIKKVPQIW